MTKKNITLIIIAAFILVSFPSKSFAAKFATGVVALVQYNADNHFNDYAVNRENLTNFANEATIQGASIIIFPEGSLYGYASSTEFWCKPTFRKQGCKNVQDVAEVIPFGQSTKFFEKIALDNKIYILFNLPENEGGVFYNTTVVVGPTGFVGKYRKRDLYYLDEYYAVPGSNDFVLETEMGRFGLLICRDAAFKGILEAYRQRKVDRAILMMNWDDNPPGSKYAAKTFFANRSAESGVSILAADNEKWDGTGLYEPGKNRIRNGLPDQAENKSGISYHQINAH